MNSATLSRRLIVITLVVAITIVNLFLGFRGLTSSDGMEKAQLGREIARGSYQSKMLRPLSIGQFIESEGRAPYLREISRADTYNAPLYPMVLGLVFKMAGAEDFEKWRMGPEETIYGLDRLVAGLSIGFFLLAAFLAYLLIGRAFDSMIAGVSFLVIITANLFWRFTETGMANCFMLMLFMAALYFIYRAIEGTVSEKNNGLIFGVIGGVFLVLLCMSHWMALWILIGYLVYSFFFIRPMGAVAGITTFIALLAFAHPVYQNMQQTGNPFGIAFYTLYSGLGLPEELVMRASSPSAFFINFKTAVLSFITNTFSNINKVFEYTGYVFVAPVFFLSLMHKFNDPARNAFKWCVLALWGGAAIGMSIYGVGQNAMYSSQLHYLFTPIMIAYGIAFIGVIWNRVAFKNQDGFSQLGYLWIIGIVSTMPMLFSLPNMALLALRQQATPSTWPQYAPSGTNRILSDLVPENQYIFSDQPWAVAWYADRYAIWLPTDLENVKRIQSIATGQKLPIAGISISAQGLAERTVFENGSFNKAMTPLLMGGYLTTLTNGTMGPSALANSIPGTSELVREYSNLYLINGPLATYYSATKVTPKQREEGQ